MKKILIILPIIMMILASCSVVFEAGVSGKVLKIQGTGTAAVSDVKVFVYTDKNRFNKDLAAFKNGATEPSDDIYVARTSTNNNGEFTVNKIVWESKSPDFGKTADYGKLYLIFYHEDYEVESTTTTIVSGSTNSGNINIVLKPSKEFATITVNIKDVAKNTLMTQDCTVEYKVGNNTEYDVANITGSGVIDISFPVTDASTKVVFKLTMAGTGWKQVESDGTYVSTFTVSNIKKGSCVVDLFMKNHKFTMPSIRGRLGGISTNPEDDGIDYYDNWTLSLYDGTTKLIQQCASVKTVPEVFSSNSSSSTYYHGSFSNLGRDSDVIEIETGDYSGTVFTKDFVVEATSPDNNTTKSFTYTFSSAQGDSVNLGFVKIQ